MVFHELRLEAWGSSRVAMGTSGTRLCFLREVRSFFELCGDLGDPLVFPQEVRSAFEL